MLNLSLHFEKGLSLYLGLSIRFFRNTSPAVHIGNTPFTLGAVYPVIKRFYMVAEPSRRTPHILQDLRYS